MAIPKLDYSSLHPDYYPPGGIYPEIQKNPIYTSDVTLKVQKSFQEATTAAAPESSAERALVGSLVLSSAHVVSDLSSNIRQAFSACHLYKQTPCPTSISALGVTVAFNLTAGSVQFTSGYKEAAIAKKKKDLTGVALASLKIVSGSAQTTGAAAFIPARLISLHSLSASSKVISAVRGILGGVGSSCFTAVAVLSLIATGVKIYEMREFRKELDLILRDPALTKEERSVKALKFLKQQAAGSPKTQELLKRVTSDKCLNLILKSELSEATSVIEALEKAMYEQTISNAIGMALGVAGLCLLIASFVCTGPVALIAMEIISLAVSAVWLIVDSYGLQKAFQENEPGRFDKLAILFSTVLAVTAVGFIFFFSGGMAPIIAAVVVGVIWLLINAICYYRLRELELAQNGSQSLA